jgi:hypothetical protein
MGRIMGCDYSISQNDILKVVYCSMIIFLLYLFNHFLLLVPVITKECNNLCYFKFDYILLKLKSTYKFK